MNIKQKHENILQCAILLRHLSDKFLTAPKDDKLKKFAEFLIEEFTHDEIKRGLHDIRPGERFPSLEAIKGAIYPHKQKRDSSIGQDWIRLKIESEKSKANAVLQSLKENGFTPADVAKYVKAYIKALHGESALVLISHYDNESVMRPALLDLAQANYKSDKAIEIGRQKLLKIKAMKSAGVDLRKLAEVY